MIAEIVIDDQGRAALWLSAGSAAECRLLERLMPFLPVKARTDAGYADYVITGDRMPGMGRSVEAQDATSKAV